MGQVIDGRKMAEELRRTIAGRVGGFVQETGVAPCLAAVVVGDDSASATYVRNKEIACRKTGIRSVIHRLPADISQSALTALVRDLNLDKTVHGILVQLPLPRGLDREAVVDAISPLKDVDAFHPENLGLLVRGRPRFVPCTPAAVVHILRQLPVALEGARCVVLGRSLIVGRPLSLLLTGMNMTVTVCHTRTSDLRAHVQTADVFVAASGAPGLIPGVWIKPGAVVIDVGISPGPDGKMTGDVQFREAQERAAFITPVPGGVGPLTVAMLLENLLAAARLQSRPAAGSTA